MNIVSARLRPHLLTAVLTALVTFVALAIAPPAYASPSATHTPSANVNGTVYASAQIGDRTFIGGEFTKVGAATRLNAAAILANGKPDPSWNPQVNGIVRAMTVSEDGSTVYLGGDFTAVGTAARSRLAAVDSTTGAVLALDTRVPNTVRALAFDAGKLYVGGSFGRIDGKANPRLAKVDGQTGVVDTTFKPLPNRVVRALVISPDGARLYAGGGFTTMSGVSRPGIAELTPAGGLTSFAPTEGGVTIAVALTQDGSRLFFSTSSNRTWAYDPAQSSDLVYRVRTGGDVQAIAVGAEEVYIGGHFNNLPEAHLSRPHIASFSIDDGTTTDWYVELDEFWGVWTFTVTPDYLAVGGAFKHVNGVAQRGFTRFAGTP